MASAVDVLPVAWTTQEGMDDPLHVELRHTIRVCCGTQAGLCLLRGIPDEIVQAVGVANAVTGVWGCGYSCPRLCYLLTGDEMTGFVSANSHDGIWLSDAHQLSQTLAAMKLTEGYTLVRIHSFGSGGGHAYFFLSKRRHPKDPLHGFIYQTNIGCQEMFDLLEWINDPKSTQVVDLEAHLNTLSGQFQQNPVAVYQAQYMLTGREQLNKDETKALEGLSKDTTGHLFKMLPKPVVEWKARATLTDLRRKIVGRKHWKF